MLQPDVCEKNVGQALLLRSCLTDVFQNLWFYGAIII